MDILAYILSRKFTEETVIGGGALKGKNCTISKIEATDDGNLVTFKWTLDDGTVKTQELLIKDGADGAEIESAEVNIQGHLILHKTDGSSIDCGAIAPGAQLQQPLTANTPIGSVTNGKTYPKGTTLETIIRDMLISYTPPSISLTTTPSTKLYDIVEDTVSTILLKATATKKSNPITKVSFSVGSTVVNEITARVAGGGSFQYQYTPETPINTDTTFKATVTDGKQTATSTFAIKFVAKSYYGICDANVSDPDATTIKGGTSVLKDTKNLTYSNITTNWGKVFYAYPKSFGALTYIKDEVNNINYFDSFQRSEKKVDGIDYYCYTLTDPTAAENNQIVFK
jgi:hypothetical protein